MSAARVATKTDRKMEDAMLAFAGDSERVRVLEIARVFKRSWIDLAEALTGVHQSGSWERWGFDSFDAYCTRELHLKKNTVAKLLGSYRFLESNAPRVIQRTRDEPRAPVPSLQAVEFVKRASDRGAAPADTLREIEVAAFDEGAEAPMLRRQYQEIAFPIDDETRARRLKNQIGSAARKLAALIAEPELPVSHDVAVEVEASIGKLLDALEAA